MCNANAHVAHTISPSPYSLLPHLYTYNTQAVSAAAAAVTYTQTSLHMYVRIHTHAHIDKQQQQPKSRERTNISRSRSAKLLRLCAHDANVDVNVVFAIGSVGSPKQHFVARALPVGASRASEPHSVAVAVTVAVASSLFFLFFLAFCLPTCLSCVRLSVCVRV